MRVIENKSIAWGWCVALWVFLAGLLVWDAGCAKPEPPAKPVAVDVLAPMRAQAVLITHYCAGKPSSYGSGLAVSPQDIVTVGHVAVCDKGTSTAHVKFPDGSEYDMALTKLIRVPDVVGKYPDGWARFTVVNGGAFKQEIVEPTLAMPKVGETVCALNSAPLVGTQCGTVTSLGDGKPTFAFTLSVVPGNSGSPVFDSNGKYVGIELDCWTSGQGVCYPHGGDAMISLGAMFL